MRRLSGPLRMGVVLFPVQLPVPGSQYSTPEWFLPVLRRRRCHPNSQAVRPQAEAEVPPK